MGGENHEKREAENLQQENGEREGGVLRWVAVSGSRWPALRRPKREMGSQAGALSTEKRNEVGALMGGGR
jgi:hypothetical protein